MNRMELVQQLAARGPVTRREDIEAVLDALADVVWHDLERGDEVEIPKIGVFRVAPAPRGRRAVAYVPATELDVAVNRHQVMA